MTFEVPALGRLTPVPARQVWPHEAHDFTPWLLQNVDVLSDLLGMDLVLDRAEHPVGDFSLDLVGKDEATGEVVIVENQLALSDHNHLGQIITYAAGTDPTTIVWVTTGFRPEHRAAIDWLNARTDENTRVFGVVIKVVQIGDSAPAPAFELVAQPNDWEKYVRRATSAGSGEVSGRSMLYRRFWETMLQRIRTEHPQWSRARTTDASWCNTAVGLSGVVLSMAFRRDALVAQIYLDDPDAHLNQARFEALHARRAQFEAALGAVPEWDRMDGRKAARIVVAAPQFRDVADEGNWLQMIDWLMDQQLRLRVAFDSAGGTAVLAAVPPTHGSPSMDDPPPRGVP
jgi:hypothetical protein